MKLLVVALGMVIAAIGAVGMIAPPVLLEFARSLRTPGALQAVLAVRVAFGVLLLWIAPGSRTPKTLRVIAIVIIVAALLALFFGIERSEALLEWWTSQDALFMRAWASLAVVFGLFIAWTAKPVEQ